MRNSRGFTLAELAIAFVIIAILLVGAIIPLHTQIDVRNTAETQRTMDAIKEAILGFAQANGRLPCPASGSAADGSSGAGLEQYNSSFANACSFSGGVVPWATLGVPETDAWGRRFTYRVAPIFADAISLGTYATATSASTIPTGAPSSPANQNPGCTPTPPPALSSSFAFCSLGDMAVYTRNDSTHAQNAIGSALPAVIISHGRNGYGAWQPNGTQVSSAPAGSDELSNVSASGSGGFPVSPGTYKQWAFYSRTPTPPASGCFDGPSTAPFCEFDDLVVMISAPTLVARMVSAGKLP